MSEYDFAEIMIAIFILLYGVVLVVMWGALAVNTWRDIIWPNIKSWHGLRRLRQWRMR